MENNLLTSDTLNVVQQVVDAVEPMRDTPVLDTICKIATVCIALANIILVFYIFRRNNNKDERNGEKSRKINLLKTLILDYNMKYLYDFFDKVKEETDKLKAPVLQVSEKTRINNEVILLNSKLRQKFTDVFLAIDESIYNEILTSTDALIDGFTESIFNQGINLSHEPMFNDLITSRIAATKTHIIKTLFNYSGE
jgi:hypothetical protein